MIADVPVGSYLSGGMVLGQLLQLPQKKQIDFQHLLVALT